MEKYGAAPVVLYFSAKPGDPHGQGEPMPLAMILPPRSCEAGPFAPMSAKFGSNGRKDGSAIPRSAL